MFRLTSKILQREFKVFEGNLYASQIRNTLSEMDLIPDGNSVEFEFNFTDGTKLSSKGLTVEDSKQENGKLSFTFKETDGLKVTMSFWPGEDGNTLKKQISFVQNNDKIIDYICLEHIGIINSKVHFCVEQLNDDAKVGIDNAFAVLGQPFYIDSLFFGCELPVTKNGIEFGIGQVKYYLGKNIDGKFECPVTVVGGAKSNSMSDVQKAFFEYIESIATPSDFRIQYNSWYDHMMDINADNIEKSFFEIEKGLSANGVAPISAYTVDDGWNDYKSSFWKFNKKFPNQLYDASSLAEKFSSSLGLWIGPRGGYTDYAKFAKRIEKAGNGSVNSQTKAICVADKSYIKNIQNFITKTTKEFNLSYWKLDGFCLEPCQNEKHSHITGGENSMYFITEMWERWIDAIKEVRRVREKAGKDLWINLTCYVNPSPWWLQYANSIWLQHSDDNSFASNCENQSQLDAQMTYRDSRYFDFLCKRAYQFPIKNIYNHEPIYGNKAKVNYTDDEFEKYLYFNACRGQALNELYISYNKLNKSKWRTLANVLKWQENNFDLLKNVSFFGGNPEENNIYGYFGWNGSDGIIALRNPSDEKTSLTLTLNKLMGCPKDLKDVKRYNIYNLNGTENFDSYSYGDKIEMTLKPFEVRIYQFGKEDKRHNYIDGVTDFTISFIYNGDDDIEILNSNDIKISVDKGKIKITCGKCELKSNSIISGNTHRITIVREKNMMLKLYIDKYLDCSAYCKFDKPNINILVTSKADNFKVKEKATPYDEIVTLKEILTRKRKR